LTFDTFYAILQTEAVTPMTIDDITVEDFRAYERVRRSGATNMVNRHAVALLTGLTDVQVAAIQRNYRQLLEKFPVPEKVKEYRVIIGEADVPTIDSGQCLIRLKITQSDEAYRYRKELLFPLASRSGRRIYFGAKPYILIPKITLTFASIPPQAESNAIGRVIDSQVKELQELEIGTAQAWYYPAEKALVLWECYQYERYRQQDLLTDPLVATVWHGFEQELLKLEPLRDAERIYTTYEDIYERPVWEQFLKAQGYRKVEPVASVKEVPAA
jgi:hypothetical protein